MANRLSSFCIRPANSADLTAVESLLRDNDLPVVGVREAFNDFFVAEADRPGEHAMRVVGAIGLERFGSHALLRSVVLASRWRGRGFGRELVERLEQHARSIAIGDLYLLTTTAEPFFAALGFLTIERAAVPAAVRTSVEFTGACPDTAVAMWRSLAPTSAR